MTNLEYRATAGELRSDGPMRISGYAAVFGGEYDSGSFIETIRPGAFSKVLNDDVRCLLNHDVNKLLGRTKSGTMTIEEDDKGLRFACDLPDSPTGTEVYQMVKRGDLSGASFSFVAGEVEWRENGARREIVTLKNLFDAGPVCYPAYGDTSVNARMDKSLAQFRSIAFCRSGGNIHVPAAFNCEQQRAQYRLILARYR